MDVSYRLRAGFLAIKEKTFTTTQLPWNANFSLLACVLAEIFPIDQLYHILSSTAAQSTTTNPLLLTTSSIIIINRHQSAFINRHHPSSSLWLFLEPPIIALQHIRNSFSTTNKSWELLPMIKYHHFKTFRFLVKLTNTHQQRKKGFSLNNQMLTNH